MPRDTLISLVTMHLVSIPHGIESDAANFPFEHTAITTLPLSTGSATLSPSNIDQNPPKPLDDTSPSQSPNGLGDCPAAQEGLSPSADRVRQFRPVNTQAHSEEDANDEASTYGTSETSFVMTDMVPITDASVAAPAVEEPQGIKASNLIQTDKASMESATGFSVCSTAADELSKEIGKIQSDPMQVHCKTNMV